MSDDAVRSTHAYYDAHAAEYAARWHASFAMVATLQRFAAMLPPSPVVLDAGCGTGRDVLALRRCGATRVVGVDYSAATVALALERLEGTTGCALCVGDVAALAADTASFDGVWCCAVLHHLPDPQPALAEFWRVLRPGGLLFTSNVFGAGAEVDPKGRYYRRSDFASALAELDAAGFEPLDLARVEGESPAGAPPRSWLNVFARRVP